MVNWCDGSLKPMEVKAGESFMKSIGLPTTNVIYSTTLESQLFKLSLLVL